MPTWFFTAFVALAVSVVGASGVWLGAILSNRIQTRLVTNTIKNDLIDQLQEELKPYREEAARRATIQDERLNRLEAFNDGYRNHIHDLRSHIWDGKPPPPPDWPADLPR